MSFSMGAVLSIALVLGGAAPDASVLPIAVDNTASLDALLQDDLYVALDLPQPPTPLKRKLFEESVEFREYQRVFRDKRQAVLETRFFDAAEVRWGEYSLDRRGFALRADVFAFEHYGVDLSPLAGGGEPFVLHVAEADAVALEQSVARLFVIFRPLAPTSAASSVSPPDSAERQRALDALDALGLKAPDAGIHVFGPGGIGSSGNTTREPSGARSPRASGSPVVVSARRVDVGERNAGPIRMELRGFAVLRADGRWLASRSESAIDQLVAVSSAPVDFRGALPTAGGAGGLGSRGPGIGIGGLGTGTGRGGGGNIDLGGRGKGTTKIVAGKLIWQGGLSREEIERPFIRVMSQIKFCYEKELNKDPHLEGKIAMFWVITATGDVSTVQTARNTFSGDSGPAIAQCVSRIIERMKFPNPKGGGVVNVTYPFVFSASGG